MSAKMTEKKRDILKIMRDTLRFHRAMGIAEYPENEDIRRFFSPSPQTDFLRSHQGIASGTEAPHSDVISIIHEEIKGCTLCQLAENSIGRGAGKGKPGARLMVVGDFSAQSGTYSPEVIFGSEEDVMLWKMMAAMELQPDQVYVTNCLKCCPADPVGIDGTSAEQCFTYLAREIAAVKPAVICAMGDMAAWLILGKKKEPLTRLRGRFTVYRSQSGQEVAVMPTFHPRFLVQHQEMKKATWNDLQAIKRRLDQG